MFEEIRLSIVIPVYNSSEIFPELHKRLYSTLTDMKIQYEIIAVVDGCRDYSAEVIASLCKNDNNLKLIEFSRNFGHQMAITAGLQHTSGEMIIVMDDDLEDPPEMIPVLIEKAEEGYDIVYGIRQKRKVSIFRKLAYRSYYILLNKLAGLDMPYDAGDFCLMRRQVVEKLNSMPETNRYLRGMRKWLGFRQTGIEYERGIRFTGKSGYSITKYIKFAFDGVFSFSYKPIHYISFFGFIIAFVSFISAIVFILLKLIRQI